MPCHGRVEIPAAPLGMRIARPTRDLARARQFYERVVGLAVVADFADHDGYDGVIFAVLEERTQLEIVHSPHAVAPQPTVEDALVLYVAPAAMNAVTRRLRAADTAEVAADAPTLNPYWPRAGASAFLDPDGYLLILTSG